MAVEGESIIFNPATGNYLITHYSAIDQKFEQLVFIPATKINSSIKTKFLLERDNIMHYDYTLSNGPDSQQVIVGILLDPVSSVTSSLPDIPLKAAPGKIMGDMINVARQFYTPAYWQPTLAYSKGQISFRVGWYFDSDTGGLTPANKAIFGFRSRDLPGMIQARVDGYAPDSQKIDGEELPDAKDGGFGQQYFALLNNDFVTRPAAVPAIVVPAPFDAAVLLDRIKNQMHTWIGMQLLDATFSSQLDRYLTAAADAYRHNQPKVVKEDVEKIRELLKREHQDLERDEEHESDKNQGKNDNKKPRMINRLAAQVLDFDLKYVFKRMNMDHGSD